MENTKLSRSVAVIDRILRILQGFAVAAFIVAAIFIPLSRRRYRRESQRRIDAARVALADRAKVGPSTADPKDLRFARPADADHPAWHYTGSKD